MRKCNLKMCIIFCTEMNMSLSFMEFFSIHFWLIPTWAKYIIRNFSIHFICSLIVLMHFSCICNAHVFHILYPIDSLRIESSDWFLSFPYFWPRPFNKKVKIWLWSHPQLFFKPTKYSELLNNLSQSFLNKIWEIYKSISNPNLISTKSFSLKFNSSLEIQKYFE